MNTPTSHHVADRALPLALAAAWPLGLLAQLPGTPLFLGPCLATICVTLALIVAIRSRISRPPFEYAFPAILLALLAVAMLFRDQASQGVSLLTGAGVFVAANVLVRNRDDALYGLAAFSVACAVVTCANFMAAQGVLWPAAIDPATRIALASAASIPDHVLLLLCGFLAGIASLTQPGIHPGFRGLMLIATLTIGVWLLSLAPHAQAIITGGTHHSLAHATRLGYLAPLLLLWLVARVSARSFLRPPQADASKPWIIPALVLVATVMHFVFDRMPAPAVLFLLGLAAAHDAPWVVVDKVLPPRWVLPGIVGALAACFVAPFAGFHTFTVADPRDHVALAEDLLHDKSWVSLDARLKFLLELQPDRPELVVLSARSLLQQGRPEAAVDRFCEATFSPRSASIEFSNHRPPDRVFLDELRDATSALPATSRGLLFERALVQVGQQDAAMNSLNIRRESARQGVESDPARLRSAIAMLLASQEFAERLEGWTGPELSGLLETSGIRVASLPSGYPDQLNPLVVRALSVPEGLRVEVWRAPQLGPDRIALPGSAFEVEGETADLHWGTWVQDGPGDWLLPLESAGGPLGMLNSVLPISFESTPGTLPRIESCATTVYLP